MRPGNTPQLLGAPQSPENPAPQAAPMRPASHEGTPATRAHTHSQESEASAEAPRASLRELTDCSPPVRALQPNLGSPCGQHTLHARGRYLLEVSSCPCVGGAPDKPT